MKQLITLNQQNRMLRIGFGKNDNQWFFRVDLWWFGVRFVKPTKRKTLYRFNNKKNRIKQ